MKKQLIRGFLRLWLAIASANQPKRDFKMQWSGSMVTLSKNIAFAISISLKFHLQDMLDHINIDSCHNICMFTTPTKGGGLGWGRGRVY